MKGPVLGVNGALRADSSTARALQAAFRRLQEAGLNCTDFPIGTLPLLDGRPPETYPAQVAEWIKACRGAAALVLTTPAYHAAVPGGLKNAIDHLDRHAIAGRPVAIIGLATGDAAPPVSDLGRSLTYLGARVVARLAISNSHEVWGPGSEPSSGAVREALDEALVGLIECLGGNRR